MLGYLGFIIALRLLLLHEEKRFYLSPQRYYRSILDEEKTIEVNINLDRPVVIAVLLAIILVETVYIFYGGVIPEKREVAREGDSDVTFEEPETVDELLFHLEVVGCRNIIEWDMRNWSGKHLEIEYADALQLAKESPFVGYSREFIAFIIASEGSFMIWMK